MTEATPQEREIKIVRVFDASRVLVWKAWTDPVLLPQWWGPKGFTNTVQEIDVREGGVWSFTMHGPEGTNYENKIIFKEIVDQEMIVFDHGEEGQPSHFRTTVTFVDQGDKTEITFHMLFPTAADRQMAVDKFGAIQGANQTLDKLGEILIPLKQS